MWRLQVEGLVLSFFVASSVPPNQRPGGPRNGAPWPVVRGLPPFAGLSRHSGPQRETTLRPLGGTSHPVLPSVLHSAVVGDRL